MTRDQAVALAARCAVRSLERAGAEAEARTWSAAAEQAAELGIGFVLAAQAAEEALEAEADPGYLLELEAAAEAAALDFAAAALEVLALGSRVGARRVAA